MQEFRLLTSNFDAEYGRNSGSQATVVARAGSNNFHGDVWEFLRNNVLNARNFFCSDGARDQGEPVWRDGWWAHQEETRYSFSAPTRDLRNRPQAVAQEVLVPSAAERAGDFSDSGCPGQS